MTDSRFLDWLARLEARHLADLRFPEVVRALRALSSGYVERRARLSERGAFDGAGKRAAYAMYYAPLHFITLASILDSLEPPGRPIRRLVDLGCGTGAAGAAWAAVAGRTPGGQLPSIVGIDANPWALAEAGRTYRHFGLDAITRRGHLARVTIPRGADAIVTGWVLNELDDDSRERVLTVLLEDASAGIAVLIVEPIALRVSPWWRRWEQAFAAVGGRSDEWRFPVALPDLVQRLDRAAGLRHDELTARSFYVPAPARADAGVISRSPY